MPIVVVKILIALALDQWWGEPPRWHPLVGFGRLATKLETGLNRHVNASLSTAAGLLAWLLAVIPLTVGTYFLAQALSNTFCGFLLDALVLYCAVGRKSLFQHSRRVYEALRENKLDEARIHTSMMVSRDCHRLDTAGCARATTESVLENGSDSLYGALFWFALLGAPGAVMYRLANTLDAMWGYRNPRFLWFGKTTAYLDDLLNYIPARLCALCYALAGSGRIALQSWRRYARHLSSPNAGPVMSSGAGAIKVRLGGPARYHGTDIEKPFFGGTDACRPEHIILANQLVDRSLILYITFIGVCELSLLWLLRGASPL